MLIQVSDGRGRHYRIHTPVYDRFGLHCDVDDERWPCTYVRLAHAIVEDALGEDIPLASLWFLGGVGDPPVEPT